MERNNFEKENEFLFNYSQKETIKKRKWTAFIHRWGEVLLLFIERNHFDFNVPAFPQVGQAALFFASVSKGEERGSFEHSILPFAALHAILFQEEMK